MATNKPYAAMQALIKEQTAAAQLMREAALSISVAANMFSVKAGEAAVESPVNSTKWGGGPNGGRPTANDNQTYRPVHTVAAPSHGRGITAIKSRVADQLHGRIGHQAGSSFESVHDENGQHIGYRETSADGKMVGFRDLTDPTVEQDVAAAGKRAGISRTVSAFSQGGLMSGARAVPFLGAGLAAAETVHAGFAQFGHQREANSNYQAIYGGSNLSNVGQRVQGEGFKLGQMFSGGLTGSQSDEAFRGVSSLGLQGPQRSQDLNFISSSYKSMGMGVAESMQLVTAASKSLNTDLSGLKDNLKSVSDAARETGQSAVGARALFASNYSALSTALPGVGASGTAGLLTQMQTGMGRSMQGLDFSSAFTTTGGQAQLASLAQGPNGQGMTISQFQSSELTGAGVPAQAFDSLMAQIAAPFLTPQVQQAINKAVSDIPGGMTTIQANPDIIGTRITPQILKMVNSNAVAAAYARVQSLSGIQPVQAVTLLIQQFLGLAGNLTQTLNKQNAPGGSLGSKQQNLAKAATPGTATGAGGGSAGKGNSGSATTAKGGVVKGVNPVVDDALSTFKGKNVIVNSAGGPRVVSIEEAAKDYTDQVAKGTATLADTGQTISDALGGEKENSYVGADTSAYQASKGQTTSKSGLGTDRGMDPAAYQAMMDKKNAKTSGNVTVTPSKELTQLLSFAATGNVQIATGGAALGVPPVPGSP